VPAVRIAAGIEAAVGAVGLVWSDAAPAGLVAASYVGFAVFTTAALVRGTPLSTCGCLGRVDTRPSPQHVVANAVGAAGSMIAAVSGTRAFADEIGHGALVAVWTALFVAGGLVALTGRLHRAHR
jgi:hypothetical protein